MGGRPDCFTEFGRLLICGCEGFADWPLELTKLAASNRRGTLDVDEGPARGRQRYGGKP